MSVPEAPRNIAGRPAQPALLAAHEPRHRSSHQHGAGWPVGRTPPGKQRRHVAGCGFWPAKPMRYSATFPHRDRPLPAAGQLRAAGRNVRAGHVIRAGQADAVPGSPAPCAFATIGPQPTARIALTMGTRLTRGYLSPARSPVAAPGFPGGRIEERESSPWPRYRADNSGLGPAGAGSGEPAGQSSRPAAQHRRRIRLPRPANPGRPGTPGTERSAPTVRIRPAQALSGRGHPTRHLVCTLGFRGQPQPGGLIINSLSRAAVDQRVSRASCAPLWFATARALAHKARILPCPESDDGRRLVDQPGSGSHDLYSGRT